MTQKKKAGETFCEVASPEMLFPSAMTMPDDTMDSVGRSFTKAFPALLLEEHSMCYYIKMIPVIGLGNPGEKYAKTRHTVAWRVLDVLAGGEKFSYDKYLQGDKAQIKIGDENVVLLKPETFMNESGKVLEGIKRVDAESLSKMIVVHDDIDLPLGTVKIAYDRGDGGHNGVKSINQYYGGKDYMRVRVGIARRPLPNLPLAKGEELILIKPDVLGNFGSDEEIILKDVLQKSADAVVKIITLGKDKAMSEINKS